jgi:hypothetical protein
LTRDEFLTRLNAETEKNRWKRVTHRMIRRWIDARLMRGPKPIGRKRGQHPDWQWPESSFQQALRICALSAQGLKQSSEIRIHLWLDGADIPFDRPDDFRQLRRNVRRVYRLVRNEMRRQSRSNFDPRSEKEISAHRAKSITRRLGEPSLRLVPLGFQYSNEEMLALWGLLLFGEHGTLKIGDQEQSFDSAISSVLNRLGFSEELQSQVPELPELARNILSGLGGDPNKIEGSAEDAIIDADEETFNRARVIFQAQLKSISSTPAVLDMIDPAIDSAVGFRNLPDFQMISKITENNRWNVLPFVEALLLVCRNKKIAIELDPYMDEVKKSGMLNLFEEPGSSTLPEKSQSDPDGADNA